MLSLLFPVSTGHAKQMNAVILPYRSSPHGNLVKESSFLSPAPCHLRKKADRAVLVSFQYVNEPPAPGAVGNLAPQVLQGASRKASAKVRTFETTTKISGHFFASSIKKNAETPEKGGNERYIKETCTRRGAGGGSHAWACVHARGRFDKARTGRSGSFCELTPEDKMLERGRNMRKRRKRPKHSYMVKLRQTDFPSSMMSSGWRR